MEKGSLFSMSIKHRLRRHLIEVRLALPLSRRKEAKEKVLADLLPRLEKFSLILSFASKEEEINLWPLNKELAKEKRLLLPRVENESLIPLKVEDFESDLQETTFLKVKEPLPQKCQLIPLDQIDCVLVPGLGFDKQRHRIGYGLGHFDRFLSKLSCPFLGIGFKEQLVNESLPVEEHDVSLTEVFLF